MLGFDWTYAHSYEIEEVQEVPGSGVFDVPVLYIPTPKGRPEHDGLWLKFRAANGKNWIGVFAFAYTSPLPSRIVSSPNCDQAFVIANGQGFLVTPGNPKEWAAIPILPVIEVRSLPEHEIVVFGDFTSLAAYGSSGMVWRSPRVCWDDLKIVAITEHTIEGSGYDPTTLGELRFRVDLKTGRSLLPPPVSTEGKSVW